MLLEPFLILVYLEISTKLTYQLGFVQVLPPRWLGSELALRLLRAALACEAIAALILRFTTKTNSTGEEVTEVASTFNSLLSCSRGLVLRMSSFGEVALSISKSLGKWILDSPALFEYLLHLIVLYWAFFLKFDCSHHHLTILTTQELLGVCWVSAIEKATSTPVLQVFVDNNQKQLKSHTAISYSFNSHINLSVILLRSCRKNFCSSETPC